MKLDVFVSKKIHLGNQINVEVTIWNEGFKLTLVQPR